MFYRPVIRRSLVCLTAVGYTQFFLTLNRTLPVVIAVFRYIHIFHWTMVVSEEQKMNIKKKCFIFLLAPAAFVSGYSMMQPGITKHYNRCMGKEEQYFFNIPDFLDESTGGPMYSLPIWHPFRLIILILFDSYLVLVPIAYLKIFIFRKNLKIQKSNYTSHKKRNIVSTGYNMTVWIVEGIVSLLVSVAYYTTIRQF